MRPDGESQDAQGSGEIEALVYKLLFARHLPLAWLRLQAKNMGIRISL